MLINSATIHADKVGINVAGKRIWLHHAPHDLRTYFTHIKFTAVERWMRLASPNFKGVLAHAHCKPYQGGLHSLCNAHPLRTLEKVVPDYKQ